VVLNFWGDMHRRWKRLVSLTFGTAVMMAAHVSSSSGQPLLLLGEDDSSVPAGFHLSVLKDDKRDWSIEDVIGDSLSRLFEPSQSSVPSFGYSRAAYWLRLSITRRVDASDDWFLSLENKSLDHVELYVPDDTGGYTAHVTGDAHPFDTREIPERHFIFSLTVPDTVLVLHMRLESNGPLYFPVRLLSVRGFVEDTGGAHFKIGALFGILIVIALFHLVFYLTTKDFTYLVYVAFLSALVLYNMSVERFAFQFLWPNNIWLADRSNSMLALVCAFLAIEFTRAFLGTRTGAPTWDRALRLAQLGCLLLLTLFVGGLNVPLGMITSIYFALAVVLVVLASIAGIRRRQPAARVFLIAWSFLLVGTVASVLGNLNLVPPHHFAGARGAQAGSIITLTLFALALGQRLNRMIRAREELRLRIANDLHDDIGAGLTQIVMESHLLRQKSQSIEGSQLAMEIESQARALSDSVRDVVWAVSPTKESWKDVEDRLHDVAAGLLGPAGILIDMKGEGGTDGRVLSLDVRQSVLHTFKETVHNAVKHSQCNVFKVRWKLDREKLWMSMQDDGIGFVPGNKRAGHGLLSLKSRIAAVRGRLTVHSVPGRGTTIELEMPL
jgi:signal transduction histidine kinase